MKHFLLFSALFILLVSKLNAQTHEVFMLGPSIHFNIHDPKFHVSYGIECSYWNWEHFPYSVDCGIEWGGKKLRLYSEAQTGVGLMGLAFGPVLQYNFSESELNLGTQGSFWLNYFAGVNIRMRFIDGHSVFSPGIYGKLPIGPGLYEDNSTNDDNDWDWD